MAQSERNSEEDVQRVEIVNSGLRWQTIAKSVRELDEEKIKEAKEDVDTLLVFSGLFSAVLSAFLVETYTKLLPDKQDEMISLLRTIASQNYTVNPRFYNVTSPILSDEQFEVPEWALRVNGLWFASLIISLSTASLGMLVKSWLREYLALDTEAPRERLRARYYREPAMKEWKVYEIVAILPLLLQVALGLFFIGLCFFTAFVDKRMGLTSLPLVSAWAFFLLLTIVAPIIWPRCPFKVHSLKGFQLFTRKVLHRMVHRRRAGVAHGEANGACSHTTIRRDEDGGEEQSVDGEKDKVKGESGKGEEDEADEEEDVIQKETHDVQVLISADTVMADDNLIDAMGEVLKQRHVRKAEETILFVQKLVHHRSGALSKALKSLRTTTPLTSIRQRFHFRAWIKKVWARIIMTRRQVGDRPEVFPDLRTLSKKAYISLLGVVTDTIQDALDNNELPTSDLELSLDNSVSLHDTVTHPAVPTVDTPSADEEHLGGDHGPTATDNPTSDSQSAPLKQRNTDSDPPAVEERLPGGPDDLPSAEERKDPADASPPPQRGSVDEQQPAGDAGMFRTAGSALRRFRICRALARVDRNQEHTAISHDNAYRELGLPGHDGAPIIAAAKASGVGPGYWMHNASLILLSDSLYARSIELEDKFIAPMCKTMAPFLESKTPDIAVEFALRVVVRRFDCFDDMQSVTSSIPDLSGLSEPAYNSLMCTVARAVKKAPRPLQTEQEWFNQARVLFVSSSPFSVPSAASDDVIATICESLGISKPGAAVTIQSVMRLVEHCYGAKDHVHSFTSIPNLDGLSEMAYTRLMLVTLETLQEASHSTYEGWQTDASILLVAGSKYFDAKPYHEELLDLQLEGNNELEDRPERSKLLVTMCNSIRAAQSSSESPMKAVTAIAFVEHLLQNQLQSLPPSFNPALSSLTDLTPIPGTLYPILMSILTNALRRSSDAERDDSEFLKSAMHASILLLSKSAFSNRISIDDELIGIMCKAVNHSELSRTDAVTFVKNVINRRLFVTPLDPTKSPSAVLDRILELDGLDGLSKDACDALMDVVAGTILKADMGCLEEDSPDWFKDATILLLSKTSEPGSLPLHAIAALRSSLDDSASPAYSGNVLANILNPSLTRPGEPYIPIASPICQAYQDSLDILGRFSLGGIFKMYQRFLLAKVGVSDESGPLVATLRRHPAIFEDDSASPGVQDILHDMWAFIVAMLRPEGDVVYANFRGGTTQGLMILLEFGDKMLDKRQGAVDVFANYWKSKINSYFAALRFASTNSRTRAPDEKMWYIVRDAFVQNTAQARRSMYESSKSIATDFAGDDYADTWNVRLDMVRFCFIHLRLYEAYQTFLSGQRKTLKHQPMSTEEGAATDLHSDKEAAPTEIIAAVDLTPKDWLNLWGELQKAVTKYWENQGWDVPHDYEYWHDTDRPIVAGKGVLEDDQDLAGKCLALMESLEAKQTSGEGTDKGVPEGFSLFPHGLAKALGQFIKKDTIHLFPLTSLDSGFGGGLLHDFQNEAADEQNRGSSQPDTINMDAGLQQSNADQTGDGGNASHIGTQSVSGQAATVGDGRSAHELNSDGMSGSKGQDSSAPGTAGVELNNVLLTDTMDVVSGEPHSSTTAQSNYENSAQRDSQSPEAEGHAGAPNEAGSPQGGEKASQPGADGERDVEEQSHVSVVDSSGSGANAEDGAGKREEVDETAGGIHGSGNAGNEVENVHGTSVAPEHHAITNVTAKIILADTENGNNIEGLEEPEAQSNGDRRVKTHEMQSGRDNGNGHDTVAPKSGEDDKNDE